MCVEWNFVQSAERFSYPKSRFFSLPIESFILNSNSDINFSVLGGQLPATDQIRRKELRFSYTQIRKDGRCESVTYLPGRGEASLHRTNLETRTQGGKSPLVSENSRKRNSPNEYLWDNQYKYFLGDML